MGAQTTPAQGTVSNSLVTASRSRFPGFTLWLPDKPLTSYLYLPYRTPVPCEPSLSLTTTVSRQLAFVHPHSFESINTRAELSTPFILYHDITCSSNEFKNKATSVAIAYQQQRCTSSAFSSPSSSRYAPRPRTPLSCQPTIPLSPC